MLSRCLYGAQLSVIIGLCAAALATVVSILIGIVSGYLGGKFDMIMQRFVDAWMSFPDLIILIVVVSVVGPGMGPVIVMLGLLYGIGGSRIIRGAVLSVRENAYVHAAQSTGATLPRILRKHILPNVMAPVIVLFTTRVGAVILAESGLAFLGLGVPPPAPTWGGMLSGIGPLLHVPGAVARAGARPLHHRRGLRHQRVRRCAARPARSAHARQPMRANQKNSEEERHDERLAAQRWRYSQAAVGLRCGARRRRGRGTARSRSTAARSRSARSM